MSNDKHSPEPWRIERKKYPGYGTDLKIVNNAGNTVLSTGVDDCDGSLVEPVFPSDEEMERVVACVNACASVPTNDLVSGAVAIIPVRAIPSSLRADLHGIQLDLEVARTKTNSADKAIELLNERQKRVEACLAACEGIPTEVIVGRRVGTLVESVPYVETPGVEKPLLDEVVVFGDPPVRFHFTGIQEPQ